MFNNKSAATAKRTPFCKVCIDAGHPKTVYESHWVKTLDGKVCCPTLLEQSCRYCKVKGHTVKFCNLLKEEEPKQLQPNNNNKPLHIIKPKQFAPTTNVFNMLYESDSDDDETKNKTTKQKGHSVKAIIPAPKPVIKSTAPLIHAKTYATVLTNEAKSKEDTPLLTIDTPNTCRIFQNIKIIKNWADYSDSD